MKSAEDLLSEITDQAMRVKLASIQQGIKKRQKREMLTYQRPKKTILNRIFGIN